MQSNHHTATVTVAGKGKHLNVFGHSITEKLTGHNTGGNYYVFECISPPGQGIPLQNNKQGDAIAAILEGEYSVVIGDKRFHVLKGDICFFPRKVDHSFQNIGTKAGITLWTINPGNNFEAFFKELGQLPPVNANPSLVAQIFADNSIKLCELNH
jgi:mannose-6-phosphate isomerase-like protein (cupin superfamily)